MADATRNHTLQELSRHVEEVKLNSDQQFEEVKSHNADLKKELADLKELIVSMATNQWPPSSPLEASGGGEPLANRTNITLDPPDPLRSGNFVSNHSAPITSQGNSTFPGGLAARLTKVEFPRFNGTKIREWIYKYEQFFLLDNTIPELKGIFLASVTKSRCLMIHDFESLYCMSNGRSNFLQDEAKYLLHISPCQQFDAIRWNPANQDEVACTSLKSNEVLIFDVAYVSSEPIEILRKRPTLSIRGCDTYKGLSDVIFPTNSDSRVVASDTHGSVHLWDRRTSNLPCLELATNLQTALNSIELHHENQCKMCCLYERE